jgi:hypothetical protein
MHALAPLTHLILKAVIYSSVYRFMRMLSWPEVLVVALIACGLYVLTSVTRRR